MISSPPFFEYLIKDYNNNSGGTYAEYYTPLSIASIIAKLLINEPTQSVKIYDPSGKRRFFPYLKR
ncbi:N-6 DNA methylase [Helicobacter pylori]|nr:N-6 DNA methylase [Helicobacter pylori]